MKEITLKTHPVCFDNPILYYGVFGFNQFSINYDVFHEVFIESDAFSVDLVNLLEQY